MKSIQLLTAGLLLSLLFACNRYQEEKQGATDRLAADIKSIENKHSGYFPTDSTGNPDPEKKQADPVKPANPSPDWEKNIIKNATLELEVKEGNSYYKKLREQVKSFGGYIAQEEQSETEYKLENRVVIKVPVGQFDQAVVSLSEKVEKIHQRKISSEEVTGEIVDTRSRLESKKQVRLRYLELLNQARNMTDILSVQSEINGIQEEIESATGRVQWLRNAAAYSTINLTYFQVIDEKAKDHAPSFGNRLSASFKQGSQWLVELLIGLVSIWPLLLGGIVAVVVVKKTFRKKLLVNKR